MGPNPRTLSSAIAQFNPEKIELDMVVLDVIASDNEDKNVNSLTRDQAGPSVTIGIVTR